MLRTKILAITVTILVLAIGVNTFVSARLFATDYAEALTSKGVAVGQALAGQLERLLALGIPVNELVGFDEQCQEIVSRYPEISYAQVVDRHGAIVFHSDPARPRKTVACAVPLAPRGRNEAVDVCASSGESYYTATLPAASVPGGEPVAFVQVGIPVRIVTQKTHQLVWHSVGVTLIPVAVAVGLLLFSLAVWVTRPLKTLLRVIEGIRAAGADLAGRVAIASKDEIGELASTFNKMMEDLERTTVSKDYVNNVVGSMTDALVAIDATARIRTVNRAACELLGYREEELLGSPMRLLYSPGSTAKEEHALGETKLERLIEAGDLRNLETFLRSKDGREISVLFSGSTMRDAGGHLVRIVCTARDITERKRAEEERESLIGQLEAKNAELDSFVYSVSHDLKAPLVAVQGLAGIIVEDYGARLDDEGRHFLDRLQINVQQMERLIQDLLEFSRVGSESRAPEVVDLAEVVDGFVAEMGATLRARGIEAVRRDSGVLWGVRTRVEQVMWNLLGNAVKYMGDQPAPRIEVGMLAGGAFVECYVKDNGIGIDPQYHEKIFEIFHRLKEVEAEGTGVGLAIARKIVEGVGGRLWVESAKGRGATFRFTWPAGPGGNSHGPS